MDITLAPARGRPRSLLNLVAIAIVGLLILGMLAAYVGSRPHARAGLRSVRPRTAPCSSTRTARSSPWTPWTATPRTVVKGAETYTYPLPSRDGRLMMFDHTANGSSKIFVSGIDGSNVHPLPGTYTDWTETDWSPDGQHLAVLSTVAGVPSLTVLASDGSSATTLPLGRDVNHFWYMADGRIAFTGAPTRGDTCGPDRGARNVCALYVVDPAGGNARQILSSTRIPGHLRPTHDGWSQHRVCPLGAARRAGRDRRRRRRHRQGSARADRRRRQRYRGHEPGLGGSRWDPHPVRLARRDREPLGGRAAGWRTRPSRSVRPSLITPTGWVWRSPSHPMGTSILASYPQPDGSIQYWLLDPTGKTPGRQVTLPGSYVPAWQRKAAG